MIRLAYTEDEINILKTMVANKHTATEVAAALPGRTRGSVAGQAHRLGLRFQSDSTMARAKSAKTNRERHAASRTEAEAAAHAERQRIKDEIAARKAAEVHPVNIPMADRNMDTQCGYLMHPDNKSGYPDFIVCGAAKKHGEPYCAGHMKDTHNPQVVPHRSRAEGFSGGSKASTRMNLDKENWTEAAE